MKTSELRQSFLDYFRKQEHKPIPSSSLVPGNDPTLLFTNAGMVQFKDCFLGREDRGYYRAASAQRCVRAGGKHNDLENVGYTARHHTFFEMLGNFSFGDYFKREAIQFAWNYLTKELKLPKERLWVTVFDEDQEAADIWIKEMGIDPTRFSRIGAKDNFWAMGDTGPCGPCTEIFYDHGPSIPGGPPGSPDEDGDRYIEIWNLVFMQYDRSKDGTLTPLPKPSVDTGMGLERIAAVMQGVHSNYEIDLFQGLIAAAAKAVGVKAEGQSSLNVIADHIRSCAFLIADGVVPSNEGRGYVLRRIIRRAARHGYELGQKKPFFHTLVAELCKQMGDAYPELVAARANVEKVLRLEEERFAETLEQGMKILDEAIAALAGGKQLLGETAFKLYDTYGFPIDLTQDICHVRGLSVDMAGFDRAMEEQRQRARAASNFGIDYGAGLNLEGETTFTGYQHIAGESKVESLYVEGKPVKQVAAGDQALVILTSTPFYAESGGQVGDSGFLLNDTALLEVVDTQKQGGVITHLVKVEKGGVKAGDSLIAEVDANSRAATNRNHSATHLLHAALRQVLGEHVSQKGSLNDPERLRFDFSHGEAVTAEQLAEVEALVNEQIRANLAVNAELMDMDSAKKRGAMALFGEKYGSEVRVLSMGEFSLELCGGTHVQRTGDIGLFRIVSEAGVAAGVRRIEAVTGEGAMAYVAALDQTLAEVAQIVKGGRDNVVQKVRQLADKARGLEKELEQLKAKLASAAGGDLASSAKDVGGIKVVAARLDGADVKALRDTVDQLKNKLGKSAVVLGSVEDGKVRLIAGVSKDAMDRVKAGELVNHVAEQVGGRGGGRPDMAQAGGDNPAALSAALESVFAFVSDKLV
ncbi:MAG: alanine--tRNA ligase [Gammaproteobacteria bacterium]|nr:alanine--tRNA ligase [Gammaproteobacteria bacterium]